MWSSPMPIAHTLLYHTSMQIGVRIDLWSSFEPWENGMFCFKVLTKCDKTCSSVAMTITFIVQFLQSGYRVVCTDGHMSLCGLDQIVFSFLVAIVVKIRL